MGVGGTDVGKQGLSHMVHATKLFFMFSMNAVLAESAPILYLLAQVLQLSSDVPRPLPVCSG